jgi:hypothetical protein
MHTDHTTGLLRKGYPSASRFCNRVVAVPARQLGRSGVVLESREEVR